MSLLSSNPIVKALHNIQRFGLEYAVKRYYSAYHGKVTSNLDTQQQGRIEVSVPEVGFGDVSSRGTPNAPGTITDAPLKAMAFPSSGYAGQDHGLYFPPEVGDPVWVTFAYGDIRQPRYTGGWWTNSDPAKSQAGSQVPAEFKSDTGIPFVRGIKTKRGHGLAFGDNPLNPFVEIWTGEQITPSDRAQRHHQFIMNDTEGSAGIAAYTFGGFKVELNDTLKKITISTPALDPAGVFAHSITLDDLLQTVTVKTKGLQQVVMNDTAGLMQVTTPGALVIGAVGGIAMGSGATPPVPPPGSAIENGIGNKVINFVGNITETIGGAVTKTIAGAVTETIAGALTKTVAGALVVNALTAQLATTGGPLLLGSVAGANFFLVNEAFLEAYFNHAHMATAPAAPTLGPIWLAPPNPLLYPGVTPIPAPLSPQVKNPPGNPFVHTTVTTKAN